MTRTSWSRSSSLVALLVVLLAVAAPVSAVSVAESDVPEDAEVGTQVTATATLDQLYKDPSYEQWQLHGETELENVSWTVVFFDQTGAKVGQETYTGQNFTSGTIAADDGVSEVQVKVTGTVPEVEEFSYDPAQSFLTMRLVQTQEGGASNEIDSWETHHYTPDSRQARQALDDARQAIQKAEGANPTDARETFDSAVDAYNSGNFDNAENLAKKAESQAAKARQSQRTFRLILYAVGALVVVGVLVGAFLWYRSQQDSYDKLG